MKLTRDFYVPKGSIKVTQRDGDGVAYLYQYGTAASGVRYGLVLFHGDRAQKPDEHSTYKTQERREKRIKEFFEGRKLTIEYKATLKQSRKTGRDLKVGDILSSTWGYEQTNVDFYQVVALVGQQSVSVRKIAAKTVEVTGWASRTVTAEPDKFVGEKITRRCSSGGICVDSVQYATKWNGKPIHETSYA